MTISVGHSEVVEVGSVTGLLSSNGVCVFALLRYALVVGAIFEMRRLRLGYRFVFNHFHGCGYPTLDGSLA